MRKVSTLLLLAIFVFGSGLPLSAPAHADNDTPIHVAGTGKSGLSRDCDPATNATFGNFPAGRTIE